MPYPVFVAVVEFAKVAKNSVDADKVAETYAA